MFEYLMPSGHADRTSIRCRQSYAQLAAADRVWQSAACVGLSVAKNVAALNYQYRAFGVRIGLRAAWRRARGRALRLALPRVEAERSRIESARPRRLAGQYWLL